MSLPELHGIWTGMAINGSSIMDDAGLETGPFD
jgi:hypothetical protein